MIIWPVSARLTCHSIDHAHAFRMAGFGLYFDTLMKILAFTSLSPASPLAHRESRRRHRGHSHTRASARVSSTSWWQMRDALEASSFSLSPAKAFRFSRHGFATANRDDEMASYFQRQQRWAMPRLPASRADSMRADGMGRHEPRAERLLATRHAFRAWPLAAAT